MAKSLTTEQVARRVEEALHMHFGRARAVPGWKLGRQIGLGTGEHAVSRIRSAVRLLRREGQVIVAAVTPDDSGNEPGYFYAKTVEEYQRYMGPFRHRAMDILETLKPMDTKAEELWGAQSRLDQMGTGQLEMPLGDPEEEFADAGGPKWYEVGQPPASWKGGGTREDVPRDDRGGLGGDPGRGSPLGREGPALVREPDGQGDVARAG